MTEELEDNGSWEQLPKFPYKYGSPIVMLNDTEFFMAPYKCGGCLGASLWKYNIETKKWSKWSNYPSIPDHTISVLHTAVINKDKSMVYIYGSNKLLLTIN